MEWKKELYPKSTKYTSKDHDWIIDDKTYFKG